MSTSEAQKPHSIRRDPGESRESIAAMNNNPQEAGWSDSRSLHNNRRQQPTWPPCLTSRALVRQGPIQPLKARR